MYKKFSYGQIFEVKTNFLKNLQNLYTNQRYLYLKEFIRDNTKYGDCVYFFEANSPVFKIQLLGDNYILSDEKEKIQINLNQDELNNLHGILKNGKKINKQIKENKTISQTLFEEFKEGKYENIGGKPYLVYDIETIGNINNLKSMRFMIAYGVISNQDHNKSIKYRIIEENSIEKFVDFMINFDGWIIGYNNIYFDNPVSIYNSSKSEEYIKILNEKSIDLFLFIRNLTGKRIGLDNVSKSLLGIGKTLGSGLEGEEYLKEYVKSGNIEAYNKVKSYCKNDVKMTLGVLLYFLKNKKIHIGEKDFKYNIEDIINKGNIQNKSNKNNNNLNNRIFEFDDVNIKN